MSEVLKDGSWQLRCWGCCHEFTVQAEHTGYGEYRGAMLPENVCPECGRVGCVGVFDEEVEE